VRFPWLIDEIMFQPNHRASRSGYLLAYTLILVAIMGSLVFTYQQSVVQRNTQVRLNTDRTVARFVARSAVDALRFAFREAADAARPTIDPKVEGGSLLPFLLNNAADLSKAVARKTSYQVDHRELLLQLLGNTRLAPIDRLVNELGGTQVLLFTTFQPAPAYPNGPIKDPVLKTVRLTYRVTARVRNAQETCETTEDLSVYSQLPAACRFTMAGFNLPDVNTQKVNEVGELMSGPAPIVLFNSPADGDVLTRDPFQSDGRSEKPLEEKPITADALVASGNGRGLVFLDSATEKKVVRLALASGRTPYGEYYSLYRPESGRTKLPPGERLRDQPSKLVAFRATDPLDSSVNQSGAVEAAFLGFHQGTNNDGILGPAPNAPSKPREPEAPPVETPAPDPDNPESTEATPLTTADPDPVDKEIGNAGQSSQIHPFGVGASPSRTVVLGHVVRTLAAVTYIGIDRDETDKDEEEQVAAIGRALPIAETNEPKLARIDGINYDRDVDTESSGTSYYRRLRSFGDQGSILNVNATLEPETEGEPRPEVSSEQAHSPLRVDLSQWKYSSLFDNFEQYNKFMCREAEIPINLSLYLSAMPANQAAAMLRTLVFGSGAAVKAEEYLLRSAVLTHRDKLHASLGNGTNQTTFIDSRKLPDDALKDALAEGLTRLYPGEATVTVKNQGEFERYFVSGGVIELFGQHVVVEPDAKGNPSNLDFRSKVSFGSTGGLLEVGTFRAPGVQNTGQADRFGPVIIRCRELVLAGKGPFQATFVCNSIRQEGVSDYSVIQGSLVSDGLSAPLSKPLIVAYDPRIDPTGEAAPLYYRVGFPQTSSPYEYNDR
jgi:hypothetical protein